MSTTKRKAARRHRTPDSSGAISLSATAKHTLIALPITAAVGLLLLLVSCVLLMMTKDPNRYHVPVGYAVLYLTAFLGGMIGARLNRRHAPILAGLGLGFFMILLITVSALLMPNAWRSEVSGGIALITRLAILPCTLIGALCASRQKQRRKRK